MMKMSKKNILSGQRASASTVIVFLLTVGFFIYIFSSSGGDNAKNLTQEGFKGFLNYEVVAMDILEKIKNDEILIKENKSEEFKNIEYSIRVKRGKDYATHDNNLMISYLIDVQRENDPYNAMQFMIVGIPSVYDYETYKYYMAMFRKKPDKGVKND